MMLRRARPKLQASSQEGETEVRKKISILGLMVGAAVGVIAGVVAGKWIVWLGLGLGIGWLIGSLRARRPRLPMNVGHEAGR
jgi:uncharacterized membrane protein YoaK (UPF0700 family)